MLRFSDAGRAFQIHIAFGKARERPTRATKGGLLLPYLRSLRGARILVRAMLLYVNRMTRRTGTGLFGPAGTCGAGDR
jgi:hypothetical protein